MQIRVAEERDVAALAQVVVTAYRSAHRDHLPPDYLLSSLSYEESAANWARTLREIHRDAAARERVFVAADDEGRVVGAVMGGPERSSTVGVGELSLLYILPSYQRHGTGRLLTAAVAHWLIGQGLRRMRVRVLRENMPARRFYAALGGEEIGEETHDDAGVTLHQVVYEWTDLDGHFPA